MLIDADSRLVGVSRLLAPARWFSHRFLRVMSARAPGGGGARARRISRAPLTRLSKKPCKKPRYPSLRCSHRGAPAGARYSCGTRNEHVALAAAQEVRPIFEASGVLNRTWRQLTAPRGYERHDQALLICVSFVCANAHGGTRDHKPSAVQP
jgi:hypothetical protein